MESLRAIRRKIRVVKNIQQITQATKMVAAARLRRVQGRMLAGRPYAEKMRSLVGYLSSSIDALAHPLLAHREVQHIGLVVVTGDKGLCGSYNHNVIRAAQRFIEDAEKPVRLMTIGLRGTSFFAKRNYDILFSMPQIGVDATFDNVVEIAERIVANFVDAVVDEVHILYSRFVSTMVQRPEIIQLLPIVPPQPTDVTPKDPSAQRLLRRVEYIFEPAAPQLLALLLPRYVNTTVYHLLLESLAAEFAARMTAMTAATDNAAEMIEHLTLQYNRARQASITKEILEVIAGAEALQSVEQ